MIGAIRGEILDAPLAERARLACGLSAALVAGVLTLALPVVVGRVTADLPAGSFRDAAVLGAILVGRTAFAFGGSYWLAVVGASAVTRLRRRLFDRLTRAPLPFHRQAWSADLVALLTADTLFIERSLGTLLHAAAQHVPTALGALVLLAVISPALTAGLGLLMASLAWIAVRTGHVLRGVAAEGQDVLARLAVTAQETFQGLETVKALGQEGFFTRRWNADTGKLFALKRRRAFVVASIEALAPTVAAGIVVAGLWWGRLWIAGGEERFGDLATFSVALLVFAASSRQLLLAHGSMASTWGAAERIAVVFRAAAPEALPPPGTSAEPRVRGSLVLDEVEFRYPNGGGGVSGLNLRLDPGEVVALVGANGSGKSTLARLLLGLYTPDRGQIRLGAQRLGATDPAAWRRRFAYLTRDASLFSVSLAENIALGHRDATPEDVRRAAGRVGLDGVLAGLAEGYDSLLGEQATRLSSGERQRVVLARLFLQDPDVILLDEAASSLDPEGEAALLEGVAELAAGRIVIVIAHDPGPGWPITRRVRLESGRIVEDRRLAAGDSADRDAPPRAGRRKSA